MSYQDKLVFPAPETSYTIVTSAGQVIYLPRDIMVRADRRKGLGYPGNKQLNKILQEQKLKDIEQLVSEKK